MKYEAYDENDNTASEIPERFNGKGQHGGWSFELMRRTKYGYVYARTSPDVGSAYYEVFRRKVAEAGRRVMPGGVVLEWPRMVVYPGDSAFGEWAWCCGTLERAMEILASFEREVIKKQ